MTDRESATAETGKQPGVEPVKATGDVVPAEAAAGDAAASTTDPDELRRDIEGTRAELGDTVEALAGKADVKAQMRARVEERTAGLRARREELRQRQADLKAKVADARGRASEATPEDAKRTASRAVETAGERPLPAIGIAFGIGLLLGRLIGRR